MIKKLHFPKWIEVLVTLHNMPDPSRYYQRLLRKVNVTGSHLRDIISTLEKKGFIIRKKTGKVKHINLTEEGRRYARTFLPVYFDNKLKVGTSSVCPGVRA